MRKFDMKMKIILSLVILLLHNCASQTQCNYFSQVQLGNTFYVYNPNYPRNYYGPDFNNQCRWYAECPQGYKCNLRCNMELPYSPMCNQDHLLISPEGDISFNGASVHCGVKQYEVNSVDNRIAVGLVVRTPQPGGRFICNLTAVARSNCECGYKNYQTKIVGGYPTRVNEYPMMAAIGDLRNVKVFAGGVIISNNYVLTAAHVLVNISRNDIVVIVGEHDLSTNIETDATTVYRVRSMKQHELFGSSNAEWAYDIGLIRTTTSITFNQKVGPICLPFQGLGNIADRQVKMLGWGTTFPGGPTSYVLREVDVGVISLSQCRQYYKDVTDAVLCTRTPGKDACQADSGGPVIYVDSYTDRLFLAGVVSWGYSCGTTVPGINTRVDKFMDWILANTPGATYCRD